MVTASKIDPKSPVFVPRYSYAEAERLAGVSRGHREALAEGLPLPRTGRGSALPRAGDPRPTSG